ncbi:hypothetical protein GCM10010452_34030 [Crossiella cryophila]
MTRGGGRDQVTGRVRTDQWWRAVSGEAILPRVRGDCPGQLGLIGADHELLTALMAVPPVRTQSQVPSTGYSTPPPHPANRPGTQHARAGKPPDFHFTGGG